MISNELLWIITTLNSFPKPSIPNSLERTRDCSNFGVLPQIKSNYHIEKSVHTLAFTVSLSAANRNQLISVISSKVIRLLRNMYGNSPRTPKKIWFRFDSCAVHSWHFIITCVFEFVSFTWLNSINVWCALRTRTTAPTKLEEEDAGYLPKALCWI